MLKNKIGYFIIASAVVWGAVIIGCSLALKGTTCYPEIKLILYGGSVVHLIFIWGILGILVRGKDKKD